MEQDIYPELKKIENEIKLIKVMIMESKLPRKNVSFRGMAKLKVSEGELEKSITEAKKSLFKLGL